MLCVIFFMNNCTPMAISLPQDPKNIFEYKKIAKKDCLFVGGVKELNFCPNEKYLYTVNQKIKGFDVCLQINQCVGFYWKCLRSNGGYIE